MNYDFNMPTRFITGENCITSNAEKLAQLGKKCMVVTGKGSAVRSGALADVEQALQSQGIQWTIFDQVEPNPLLVSSHRAGQLAREYGAEFVLGIGGGSALDAAKAVAVFAANPMEDPMAVYQYGWKNPVLPIVAVGTTAGTGSEVGPFAVMTTPDGLKASFSTQETYPALSFGDPKYTHSLPYRFTVSTALDALSHAIEGYFSTAANNMSDLFAIEAVRMLYTALTHLEAIGAEGEISASLREELYYASVVAGVTLAHCGTSYPHRFGYFLTEEHDVAHGTACAVFLPHYLKRAVELMDKGKVAAFFSGAGCTEEELIGLIKRLTDSIPAFTLDSVAIATIVARGVGSKNFANTPPAGLEQEEARQILQDFFGEKK